MAGMFLTLLGDAYEARKFLIKDVHLCIVRNLQG